MDYVNGLLFSITLHMGPKIQNNSVKSKLNTNYFSDTFTSVCKMR